MDRKSAPSDKACDLNTAVSWMLQMELGSLPDAIRFQAKELREAISDGKIAKLYLWYIHNLLESSNVKEELKSVEATASSALANHYPNSRVQVKALEVGRTILNEWYHDTQSPILVNEDISIVVDNGFEVRGPAWKSYITSVPLHFLRRHYKKHGTKLFSANVRDYLGSRSSDSNINNGIKKTAENEPDDFWAYNNGLTILVNYYEAVQDNEKIRLSFSGMSIVNGAQTTGSIGSLQKNPPQSASVSVRFVQTDNQEIVYNIIRYNNSQNKVAASDFRSTDQIQKRLREEMSKIPNAEYEGGRRGGSTDAIRRRPNLLPSYTVGQALAALHGDPTVAYNQKAEIWSSDMLYSKYFNEHTSAAHVVFAFSLLKSVEGKKLELLMKSKENPDGLMAAETSQLSFFRRRGSTYLFAAAIAASLEVICKRRIPNLLRISFGPGTSPDRAKKLWDKVVVINAPLCNQLDDAFTYGLQNQERVRGAVAKFTSLVEVRSVTNAPIFKDFASYIRTK